MNGIDPLNLKLKLLEELLDERKVNGNHRVELFCWLDGEVVLVHNKVWHRSGRSRTGKRRLAFSVCFMDGSTRCLRKKRAPRVFFPVFGLR